MLLHAFATERNRPTPSSWLWQQEEVKQLKVWQLNEENQFLDTIIL